MPPRNQTNVAKGKRRYRADPIAAAALDALGSDSDDEIVVVKKKKPNNAAKVDEGSNNNGRDRNNTDLAKRPKQIDLSHLKPSFSKDDKVYAAWTAEAGAEDEWFRGSVKSVREVDNKDSPYGPTRYYNVEFDDGDKLNDVVDYLVCSSEDYEIIAKNPGRYDDETESTHWVGVKTVTDNEAKGYPKIFGWYVATIDGRETPFAHLSGKYLHTAE